MLTHVFARTKAGRPNTRRHRMFTGGWHHVRFLTNDSSQRVRQSGAYALRSTSSADVSPSI